MFDGAIRKNTKSFLTFNSLWTKLKLNVVYLTLFVIYNQKSEMFPYELELFVFYQEKYFSLNI